MKNWTWKTWLMAGAVALVFVGAAVSLVVLITTEPAPTLLRVCWTSEGPAQYAVSDLEGPVAEAACAQPEPLVWDHLPLTVALVPGDEEYSDELGEVLSLWNSQVGPLFIQTSEPALADITVDWYAAFNTSTDPVLGRSGGYCVHSREGGRLRADMVVRPAGDIRTEYQRGVHEMGHCMGLGHWIHGVMRTDYAGGDRDSERMAPDRVGDGQVALLRRVYHF